MQVSFLIPLYNCLGHTRECLRSLQATLPAGLPHEIIFVDDGSTDGTREWLAALPDKESCAKVRFLLNERNLGFAGACNRAAAAATGEWLFFLNNDLVFLPGWFEPMATALRDQTGLGVVGNVQLNFITGAIDHAGVTFNPKGKPEHVATRGPFAYRRRDAVTGACFGIQRSLWLEVGGFDEAYRNGCEDIDLALRLLERGRHNVVALRSIVRHHISASTGRKSRDEQNTRRLFRRWRHQLAQRITRHCAWDCVVASIEEPRNYHDARLARDAFLHWLRLMPRPGHRLLAAAELRLEAEFRHWDRMLDGAPITDDLDITWPFRAVRPSFIPAL